MYNTKKYNFRKEKNLNGVITMEIDSYKEGRINIVTVKGPIKLGDATKKFSTYLKIVLKNSSDLVLIDLSDVDYMDSTGIGELVGNLQLFSHKGRALALLSPNKTIMKLLKFSHFEKIIPIYMDKQSAIKSTHT